MTGVSDDGAERHATAFEDAYRRHEFSELVGIALLLADCLGGVLRKRSAAASGAQPLKGGTSRRRLHGSGLGPPAHTAGDG